MGQLRSALSAALLQGSPPAAGAGAARPLRRPAARRAGLHRRLRGPRLGRRARCAGPRPGTRRRCCSDAGRRRLLDGDGPGPCSASPTAGRTRRDDDDRAGQHAAALHRRAGRAPRRAPRHGLARLTGGRGRHWPRPTPCGSPAGCSPRCSPTPTQPDDVAVLAARLLPAAAAERLPADPTRLAARAPGRRRLGPGAPGCRGDSAEDLQLALGEALANAVEHAYPGAGPGECAWSVARDRDGGVRVVRRGPRAPGGRRRPTAGHRGRGLELIARAARPTSTSAGPTEATTTGRDAVSGSASRPRDERAADGPGRPARRAAGTARRGRRAPGWRWRRARTGCVLAVAGEVDLAIGRPALDAAAARAWLALPAGAP